MTSSLKIHEIDFIKYKTIEYIITNLYFSKMNSQKNKVLVYFRKKIHIVDNFRIKLLINNDIINFENIIVDVINKNAFIKSYKIKIEISARSRDEFIKKKIHIKSITLISPHNNVIFLIKFINLSKNRDFLFEFFT